MPLKDEITEILKKTENYFTNTLLPFWVQKSPDSEYGGFLTYFDHTGKPTGKTIKTFLMQIRMLYSMSAAHRAGYGDGKCGELAKAGCDFILEHYWDNEYSGWFWIADRSGSPTVTAKIGYGQCFAMYAFSEYYLATGDKRGWEAAEKTYTAICRNMADMRYGGFYEIMERDWNPGKPGKYGGDRKSMDVHMHMMEALTSLYEITGSRVHRGRLLEVIDILTNKMLHPETGLGYIQFSLDFTPLPAIMFDVEWGRDAEPEDGLNRPLENTSYGHNVEFAWLLLHAADILGQNRQTYKEIVQRICDHCTDYGIDRTFGGVFVEGPQDAPPVITEKQFWQQAEVLIGMLDAFLLFGDEKYWNAFRNVYDFVFNKFITIGGGGEWYERLDREGNPVDNALGHEWKISYHTIRSMIETIKRLKILVSNNKS